MLEAVSIRFLWVLYALRLKRTPGLCPPQCSESHTYRFPCRCRIRTGWYASYLARPKVYQRSKERRLFFDESTSFGSIVSIEEDENGILVTGSMTDAQAQMFAKLISERKLVHHQYR